MIDGTGNRGLAQIIARTTVIPNDEHAGDQELCGVLLAQSNWLRAFIAHRIPARYQAHILVDDVLQDVWASALDAYSRFQPQGEHAVRRWLATIARHKVIDGIRAVRRPGRVCAASANPSFQSDEGFDPATLIVARDRRPSSVMRVQEAARQVHSGIRHLRSGQRTAVYLRYVAGWSVAEIARATGRTLYTVNGLIFRGIRNVRLRVRGALRSFADTRVA